MTDINSQLKSSHAGRRRQDATIAAAEARVVAAVELLFFAYRDFTSDPDAILSEYGFGRAHHRVLHFVARYPGLRVADLLDILKITKQSLSRVLKQLIAEGYVEQRSGKSDRRERRLFVSTTGFELARRLLAPQIARVGAALESEGNAAGVEAFLLALVSTEERNRVRALLDRRRRNGGDQR